jgi:hypothetical protein
MTSRHELGLPSGKGQWHSCKPHDMTLARLQEGSSSRSDLGTDAIHMTGMTLAYLEKEADVAWVAPLLWEEHEPSVLHGKTNRQAL